MDTLIIEASAIECNEDRREISGKIVPMGTGEIGQTNMGGVVFEAGSIEISDPTKIKLLSQHDMKKPVGRMIAAETRADGIYATFKLSRSSGGNDALVMAQEGLVSGLSIGAEVTASKPSRDGYLVVTAAKLKEVSLVTEPAFKSAQVLEIAAEEVETPAEPNTPTESEAVVENTPDTVAAPEVEATAVEAARPTVAAMAYTKPRIEVTKIKYLENTLKASLLGDEDAKQYLKAADNDQSTGAGFIPTPQSNQLLNFLSNADRPLIDSISRGTMPQFGKTFELPKITEVPVVDQIDENAAVTESQLEAEYITVTKKSFKGRAISTLELISNSTPAFLEELLRQMEVAYAKDTEQYVTGEIADKGTLNATGAANSATGILGYVSSSAAAIYKASLGFAKNIVVTPEQWANIMSYNDNGRPIYIASNPMNNAGALAPDSVTGTVAGLQLRVSRYIVGAGGDNTADYSMVIVNPEAYTWYEDSRQQFRTNINSDGTVDILLFGQGALATKLAAGANWFNKA
jgi:HK97 family phage prohead protease